MVKKTTKDDTPGSWDDKERWACGQPELRWLRWYRLHPRLASAIVTGQTHISVTVMHTDIQPTDARNY
jgi:hypothetical protein